MKCISVCVSEKLLAHLQAIAKAASLAESRRVTLAELFRRALIEHYQFDRVKINHEELDPVIGALLRQEEGG